MTKRLRQHPIAACSLGLVNKSSGHYGAFLRGTGGGNEEFGIGSGNPLNGYSDATGSTQTWGISSATGLGTFTGVATTAYTTASIGGSALTAGTCASGTASITGVSTSMAVVATPVTYPGDAFYWKAYVSAAGTVTVKVCTNLAAGGHPDGKPL